MSLIFLETVYACFRLAIFSLLHLVQTLYQQYCKVAWKVVLSMTLSSRSVDTWPKDHHVFRCRGFLGTRTTCLRSTAFSVLEPAAFNDTQYQRQGPERSIVSIQHLPAGCDLTSVHHLSCCLDWRLLLFTVILCMKLCHNLTHPFHFSQCLQYRHVVLRWETKITDRIQVWMASDAVWVYTVS